MQYTIELLDDAWKLVDEHTGEIVKSFNSLKEARLHLIRLIRKK